MAKPEQLLIIEPQNELKFRGPFTQPVTSHMSLKNPTDKTILFKIKTTAPKKYCVRPNCGVVEPKCVTEITICLQPFVFDPNEKNKHKFMVQSLVAPEGDYNFDQLWKEVSYDQLMDSKLRCVFELPVDNNPKSTSAVSQASSTLIKSEGNTLNESNMSSSSGDIKPTEFDFVRAAAEIKELREEGSQLRQENIELKEQILRLKAAAESKHSEQSSTVSAAAAAQFQNKYSPPQLAQQQMPIIYVIAAIAMAIFGLILGKFVL
jgi:transposase-like protein